VETPSPTLKVGRYAIYGEIASGGMATVHFGRLVGSGGFSRTVAIKRLHRQFAKDPEFVNMFLDESRLAGRIHHPNVVQTLDVVVLDAELFLVMEYLEGESLARLAKTARERNEGIPSPIAAAVVCGTLHGLHAAHEATDERGVRLDVVHRDLSPHNILVGADGLPRVIDFGIARAAGRLQMTREGQLKGKLAYMAPEQLLCQPVDPRTDVYAAGAVLWETLTGRRLFDQENQGAVIAAVLTQPISPPSTFARGVPKELDEITMRALHRAPAMRFASAREMALAIEASVPIASPTRIASWVLDLAGDVYREHAKVVSEIERDSVSAVPSAPVLGEPPEEAVVSTRSGTITRGSSVSVLPAAPRSTRSGLWMRVSIAVGAGVLVAVSAVSAVHTHGGGSASESRSSTALADAPPLVSAIPARLVAPAPQASSPAVVEPAPALPLTAATSSAAPSPVASAVAKPAAAATTSTRPSGEPKARPCTVTSYIDDSGFTHFARQCR
jgi:eukaryotic-like serine/threonine-protein kinase